MRLHVADVPLNDRVADRHAIIANARPCKDINYAYLIEGILSPKRYPCRPFTPKRRRYASGMWFDSGAISHMLETYQNGP
jgi:hypothetical protein